VICPPRQHRHPHRRLWTSFLAVALPASFDPFAQISSAMACPHAKFIGSGIFGAHARLSTCISSSSGCPECELLLRVVENYKPGWIEEKKFNDGYIRVLYKGGPVLIELVVGKPYPNDGFLLNVTELDSFRLLRHSPGTRFPLCRTIIN
jgi:hypothetical protein